MYCKRFLLSLLLLTAAFAWLAPGAAHAQSGRATVCKSPRLPFTSFLYAGESLVQGQYLLSPDGRFSLFMQQDGNLVLYKADGSILWSSNTTGHPEYFRVWMSPNGALALLDRNNLIIGVTPTDGHPGAFLSLQSDGNLVILDGTTVIWSTNTAGN